MGTTAMKDSPRTVDVQWIVSVLPEGVDTINRIVSRVLDIRAGKLIIPPQWLKPEEAPEPEPTPSEVERTLRKMIDLLCEVIEAGGGMRAQDRERKNIIRYVDRVVREHWDAGFKAGLAELNPELRRPPVGEHL